jgi:hypothetical protein
MDLVIALVFLMQAQAGEVAPAPAPEATAAETVVTEAPAQAQPAQTETSQPAENQEVCRNVRRTGTRFATRECLTVAETDERMERGQQTLQEWQRVGTNNTLSN